LGDDGWVIDEQPSLRRRVPSWWGTRDSAARKPPGRFALRTVVFAVATVLLLGVAAWVTLEVVTRDRSHTIQGALDVGTVESASGCRLAPTYQGIAKGTAVTITDVSGAVVARSRLGFGRKIGPYCEFLFSATVPDRAMYRIEIDHRGQVTYSKAYLDFYRWNAGLALRDTTLSWS
jgi:hypothetical protein